MVILQTALAVLALSGTGQTVLLDFYTDTCGPCKEMTPTVGALEKAGYPVQRVNIGRDTAMAAKYGVQRVPCFIMVADGKVVDRIEGKSSYGRLEQMCKLGTPAAAIGQSPAMLAQNSPPRTSSASPAWSPESAAPFEDRGRQAIPLQPVSASVKAAGGDLDSTLIAASVRLRITDPDGRSCGSGTLIDARGGEALILTCGHIFRDSHGDGQIMVDLFGSNGPQQVVGRLISYDLDRDVGLVAIPAPGPLTVARVAPPGYRVDRGTPVVSVGCNNGDPPTARRSQVTSLNKFLGPSNIQVAGQPVEGRSGGGLFTGEGYVIGVCNAADPSDKEGLFAAPDSIHTELDRKNLSFVYKSPSGSPQGDSPVFANAKIGTVPSPVMPKPMPGPVEQASLGPASASTAVLPSALPPSERAALEEIRRRVKEGAEVVCIIRSRENPAAKSEVIMLDGASPEFVRQLSADSRPQNKPYQTSLELPPPRKVLLEWSADGVGSRQ